MEDIKNLMKILVLLCGVALVACWESGGLVTATAQDKTIPLKVKKGEALSADVLNDLLERVAYVAEGFSSSSDIVGIWQCTTFSSRGICSVPGFTSTPGGVLLAKTQEIEFSCANGSCKWVASSFFPGSCDVASDALRTSRYQIQGHVMASMIGIHTIRKLSPNKFSWQINSSSPQLEFVECVRNILPPLPPSDLSAFASVNALTLRWIDNSSNETGFIISRRGGGGVWEDIALVASGNNLFQDAPPSTGTYDYRVRATQRDVESIGSNVATVQIP